jgi:hypothetical protein
MVGKMHGFIAHIKACVPECTSSYYVIHCQGPAVKESPNTPKMILDKVAKIVNFIN